DPKSSSSICSFLSPSARATLFLSTRLPVWSVTATVLIEASSSSLNHNSTVFGACLRAALAFGSERSRRAWADATDAQRKKVSASSTHPAVFHPDQPLFTIKGSYLSPAALQTESAPLVSITVVAAHSAASVYRRASRAWASYPSCPDG